MNLSREWLSEFVDTSDVGTKEYCDRMTDTGSKVEGFESLSHGISGIVIGKIVKKDKHPDADRLSICQIEVGKDGPVQIVTSAQNVYEGAVVPACLDGATLPDGMKIKATKFRGVDSYGMMCSFAELGLTEHEMPGADPEGILLLNEVLGDLDYPLGTDICEYLGLRTDVVEFEITPNRPDCLSVIGLARESGASFGKEVKYHTPVVKGSGDDIAKYLDVSIESPLCSRYTARVVKNVKIAPSPLWMRMRLFASGVRPINNIVDITNYVMLEYGQPMHAFDYACLAGSKITVAEAAEGEEFMSLDDIPHTLKAGMLTIRDSEKPVALAGVMGGANSEIKDNTAMVVFESACFDGASVRVTSRALGMRTESSGRFEKGLDCENTMGALERACELVELLGAGEVVDGIIDVYPVKKETARVKLEVERINRFLGVDLSEEYMREVLQSLDFTFDGDDILVPSFRDDVRCMNDIAEEVIRIYGYNKIEATPFKGKVKPGVLTPSQKYRRALVDLLVAHGLYESCTFSFMSGKNYDKIRLPEGDTRRNSVVISNPLGEDTSVMRTTILPSILDCLARNANYHGETAGLFEIAKVYIPTGADTLPEEPYRVTLGFYGDGDFYRLKGIMEAICESAGIKDAKYVACTDEPTFHPGRCATLYAGDAKIGTFGQIHPLTAENYGFGCEVYAAELDLEAIMAVADFEKHFTPLPKFPALTRDFAFVCDDALEVGTIEEVMKRAGGKTVESIKLFDIYRGEKIGAGKKSVAFSVSMRAADRTLTDDEANKTATKIRTLLERELGLVLRA